MSIHDVEYPAPPKTVADILEIQREAIRLLRQAQGRLQSGAWGAAGEVTRAALRRIEELAQL
jgi:hypothetical protein